MEHDSLFRSRHSAAHLLAMAVLKLRPDAKLGIGPVIDTGFYYDFDLEEPLTPEDFSKLEEEMNRLIKEDFSFERKVVSHAEAKEICKDQPLKLELIDELPEGEEISIYQSGDFIDLCKGPHVEKSGEVGAIKILSLAGAYWRGSEKNQMLQRIYGTAFATQAELDEFLERLEQAKARDHRKLGAQLDLFAFSELVGAGLPLWTPKGTLLRNLLDERVWQLRQKRGFERVEIPHITKKDLYEKSGHWDKFKDELFRIKTREGHEFAMKPMNCPHHTQIFARKAWSYRDMPQRYANTTICYRDEQTGELNGLSRVRSFTQDDAHTFCRENQMKDEMKQVWDIIEEFYTPFGFDLHIRLSFHDPEQKEKYLGEAAVWEKAERALQELVEERGATATIAKGEAAFYGPKIDFMGQDSLGREWQVATIQLDMNLPERFDLTCVNEKGENERIVMLHVAVMGSIERFLSILIEHTAGDFPLWLAPVQVAILPISEKFNGYVLKIQDQLKAKGIRVWVDDSNESVGKKIRNAEGQKYPLMLIIGQKEEDARTVSVRSRLGQDHQEGEMNVEELINSHSFDLPQ